MLRLQLPFHSHCKVFKSLSKALKKWNKKEVGDRTNWFGLTQSTSITLSWFHSSRGTCFTWSASSWSRPMSQAKSSLISTLCPHLFLSSSRVESDSKTKGSNHPRTKLKVQTRGSLRVANVTLLWSRLKANGLDLNLSSVALTPRWRKTSCSKSRWRAILELGMGSGLQLLKGWKWCRAVWTLCSALWPWKTFAAYTWGSSTASTETTQLTICWLPETKSEFNNQSWLTSG